MWRTLRIVLICSLLTGCAGAGQLNDLQFWAGRPDSLSECYQRVDSHFEPSFAETILFVGVVGLVGRSIQESMGGRESAYEDCRAEYGADGPAAASRENAASALISEGRPVLTIDQVERQAVQIGGNGRAKSEDRYVPSPRPDYATSPVRGAAFSVIQRFDYGDTGCRMKGAIYSAC